MAIIESELRGTDIMPFAEAQREASVVEVPVGFGRFIGVADENGDNFVSVRLKGSEKVYARECHDGHESIVGNVKLSKGESYDVALGDDVVKIRAGERMGLTRVFEVEVPDGMTIQTGR